MKISRILSIVCVLAASYVFTLNAHATKLKCITTPGCVGVCIDRFKIDGRCTVSSDATTLPMIVNCPVNLHNQKASVICGEFCELNCEPI